MGEFLYDLFTECIRNKCEPRVLVACNKQDLESAKSPEELRKLLEDEMDELKNTRHSLETVDGDEGDDIRLGTDGEKFDLDADSGLEVEFCACSAKKGTLEKVDEFIADIYEK